MTDEAAWELARQVYEAGGSYRQCEARTQAAGNRLTHSRVRRRAQAEGWAQGELTATSTPEERRAQTAAATETVRRKWAEEKDRILSDLVGTIDRLNEQVFSPHRRIEVKVLGLGEGRSEAELVEVEMDEPSPADKKALVTSMAILIDKAQLLAGEATSRTESGPIADRAAAEARVRQIRDELAERRGADAIGRAQAAG